MGTTHYDKKLWRNNGRVTSISDLLGAQVILVQRHGVGMTKNSNPYERSNASPERTLSRLTELRLVSLSFREGHQFWLRGDAFKKTRLMDDSDGFSIVFPTSEDGFEKIRPKD
jgi:hypothetical protein